MSNEWSRIGGTSTPYTGGPALSGRIYDNTSGPTNDDVVSSAFSSFSFSDASSVGSNDSILSKESRVASQFATSGISVSEEMSDFRNRMPCTFDTTVSNMHAAAHTSSSTNYIPAPFVVQKNPQYQSTHSYLSRQTFDPYSRAPRQTNDHVYGNQTPPELQMSCPQPALGNQESGYEVLSDELASASETPNVGPPMKPTTANCQILSADRQSIKPELNARIDKGFFFADQNWTCYRRNYFSVTCSFSLQPQRYTGPLYLIGSSLSNTSERILSFAMTISAVVGGPSGKQIELVQHTPKRDKGPQGRPDRIKLQPCMVNPETYSPSNLSNRPPSTNTRKLDTASHDLLPSLPSVANFERIQFKSATQNNGRRRAAQQYYHLVIELYAEVAPSMIPGGSWIKVASRVSHPMVVRGRSPGHYQDDRRSSLSSTETPGSSPDMESDDSQYHSTTNQSDYGGVDDSLSIFSSSGSSYSGSIYNGQGPRYLGSLNCSPEATPIHLISPMSNRNQFNPSIQHPTPNEESVTIDSRRTRFPIYHSGQFETHDR